MSRHIINVVVTTSHQQIVYNGWVTEARTDRKGNLRLYQGVRQRVFHPAGEWTKYSVAAPQIKGDDHGNGRPGMDGPG
jgi:hypothetical protein